MENSRLFATKFASVYPHYVNKACKKNRTENEVLIIVEWLTGYTAAQIKKHLVNETTIEDFFAKATHYNPMASEIKGLICGYRVENIEHPIMKKIRQLDKLIDELAKGKAMEKILRS